MDFYKCMEVVEAPSLHIYDFQVPRLYHSSNVIIFDEQTYIQRRFPLIMLLTSSCLSLTYAVWLNHPDLFKASTTEKHPEWFSENPKVVLGTENQICPLSVLTHAGPEFANWIAELLNCWTVWLSGEGSKI